MIDDLPISKAEIARQLGVSRTYVTLLAQSKRKPSKKIVDKLTQLKLTRNADVNLCNNAKCGPLAQLAEHLTFNQVSQVRDLYGLPSLFVNWYTCCPNS